MNARRSPGWILGDHAEDQCTDFLADTLSADASDSGKPLPIQPKTGTMPVNNRSKRNQDEWPFPSGPESAQHNPVQPMHDGESAARSFGVQRQQLLAQSEVFENEFLSGAKCGDNPAEEMPKLCKHGKNLTGTTSLELVPTH